MKFKPEEAPPPPLDLHSFNIPVFRADPPKTGEQILAEARERGDLKVTYTEWEDDPDSPYMYETTTVYHGRSPSYPFGHETSKSWPKRSRQRRRRSETAVSESGQSVGRWEWEYRVRR